MTPQTISVAECEAIIDRLANKELTLGCQVRLFNREIVSFVGWDMDLGTLCFYDTKNAPYTAMHLASAQLNNLNSIVNSIPRDMNNMQDIQIIGHRVFLNDVLDKLSKHKDGYVLNGEKTTQIVDLWWNCGDEYYEEGEKCLKNGWKKSLNQILDSAETETSCCYKSDNCPQCIRILKPNTPQSNLFLSLNQLFN